MNTLEIEVSRPHYIHRNEQFDRKEQDKPIRVKSERKSIPIKNIAAPGKAHSFQDEELAKIRQLKEWLLQLLTEAKNSWEEQLISKKNMILLMKKGHRERLMRILQYIQGLRKKAYEQYRHVCDKSREECCTICYQRGIFFNESVKNYLKEKEDRSQHEKVHQAYIDADHKEEGKSGRKASERHSAMNITVKQKRESRYSHVSDRSSESNESQEFLQSEAQKVKNAPLSKFRKGEKERTSHKVSSDRNSQVDIKLLISQQRENGLEYRFNQLKKEEQEQKPQSRVRKSGIPSNLQDLSTSKMDSQSYLKAQDSNSKRNSRSSIRQSVLKQATRGSYQQTEFTKPQFKLIDAEQATLKKQSAISAGRLISKFNLPRNSQNYDGIVERPHKNKKTIKGRNNKYIKKNEADMVEILMTSSSDSDDEAGRKRERDEIESLMREKEYLRNENYKKISRYRRERMFYDVIKQEILHGEGMEDILETEVQEPKDLLNSQYSSHDCESVQEIDQTTKPKFPKPRLKKYSLMQRKESLISKLAMLNDGNTFQSIKGKFQEILNQSGNMIKEDTNDKNPKNTMEKFLSEVLKITDLKRLMKDKFFKEADWSPKMREMHQFYTYLQYSMEAFRSKLKKTAQLGWKELSYEGKIADSKLDGLILDNQMRDWQGLELSNIGEQHHREIECSMKYYGIDVKRLKNLNHLNCQLSCSQSLNPIFSSVGQRSMKNIQEISEPIFIFP